MSSKSVQVVPKPVSVLKAYPALVKAVRRELEELDFFVKCRTAEGHWKIGRYIHEHLLENQQRARYGATIYERLAKDVGRDRTTLQRSVQFFRAFPIRAERRELTWEHYKSLITVKDQKERKKLEGKVIEGGWNSTKLREYLSHKRESAVPNDDEKPVEQLKFTRGRLNTLGLVKPLIEGGGFLLDLGFRVRVDFPQGKNMRLKEADCIEVTRKNGRNVYSKTTAKKEEIFTYKAAVEKIIDGDTLTVLIDAGFGISIEQKLRLRGIDCPEIDTAEGKAAKKFVEACLKGLECVVVKTYKDTSDKYDRYLSDIFFLPGEADANAVAKDGRFLNQELLNERLAVVYGSEH